MQSSATYELSNHCFLGEVDLPLDLPGMTSAIWHFMGGISATSSTRKFFPMMLCIMGG